MSSWRNLLLLQNPSNWGSRWTAKPRWGRLRPKIHLDRVLNYIDVCKQEGNNILTGGRQPDNDELKRGYYLEPTIVEAKPGDTVFQQEVFGPFVSVTRFKGDAEALELANANRLRFGQWTMDQQPATRP